MGTAVTAKLAARRNSEISDVFAGNRSEQHAVTSAKGGLCQHRPAIIGRSEKTTSLACFAEVYLVNRFQGVKICQIL